MHSNFGSFRVVVLVASLVPSDHTSVHKVVVTKMNNDHYVLFSFIDSQ